MKFIKLIHSKSPSSRKKKTKPAKHLPVEIIGCNFMMHKHHFIEDFYECFTGKNK